MRAPNQLALTSDSSSAIQEMRSVAVGGPGLVSVGVEFVDGRSLAAVWYSTDGLAWVRVPHDDSTFGDAVMNGVVVGGPGLVAVGSASFGRDTDAAVWTSPDGIAWARTTHVDGIFGGTDAQEMVSVTAGGAGLVAVGLDLDPDQLDSPSGVLGAAIWTSADGLGWQRVSYRQQELEEPLLELMLSVASHQGDLYAVGYQLGFTVDPLNPLYGRGAIWLSDDGGSWLRVDGLIGFPGNMGQINDVVSWGSDLVLVGASTERPGAWSRSGGGWASWVGGDETASMDAVTPGGPGLVAVGEDLALGDGAVWVCDDLYSWTRVSSGSFGGSGGQSMTDVASFGGRLVVVGHDGRDASVWLSMSVPSPGQ